jgi:hypothetical protein
MAGIPGHIVGILKESGADAKHQPSSARDIEAHRNLRQGAPD